MEPLSSLWPISDVPSQHISIHDGPEVFLSEYGAAEPVHQTVFAASWFQGEVLNGGLTQFFGNSTGVLAPEAVQALVVLGMPRLASKLQEAMDWFGSPYPRERELRQAKLEEFSDTHEEDEDPFEALSEEVSNLIYEEGPGLESAALAYVRPFAS